MRRIPILAAFWAISLALAAGQVPSADLEAEIAQVDRLVTDPDTKLQLLQLMALDLGTHRNHLILLKKQSEHTFGRIYVEKLRARGLNDDAIIKKLRSIQRPISAHSGPGKAAARFQPIAYVGTAVDHNSAGTFVSISPEVGIDSRRFAFVAGVPIYRISATDRRATGIGDAYAAAFIRQPVGPYEIGSAFTLAAPTGNRDKGLGAGRVSVDLNGTVQRRFERVRPFVSVGFTNSVFNNVGYQRPFISNGNSIYASGGIDYRVHRRFTAGLGGFGLHAMGDQMVISQMVKTAPAGTSMPGRPPGQMPPGMGAGLTGSGSMPAGAIPFYRQGRQTVAPGSEVSDQGVTAWTSWSLSPSVTLSIRVARSIPYQMTTVRAGLGFDLSRPLSRLLRK